VAKIFKKGGLLKKKFLLSLLIPFAIFSHRIELSNGEIIKSDSINMKNDSIYANDTVRSKKTVKSIIFGEGGLEKGDREQSKDIKEILENRKRLMIEHYDFYGIILLDKGISTLFPDGTSTNHGELV